MAFVMSREETFVNSRTRHAMDIWAAACVDDTGRITQKGIRLNAYSGAYGSNGHAVAAYAVTNYFQLYPALGKQVGESATVYTNMLGGSYAGLWDSTGGLCDGVPDG